MARHRISSAMSAVELKKYHKITTPNGLIRILRHTFVQSSNIHWIVSPDLCGSFMHQILICVANKIFWDFVVDEYIIYRVVYNPCKTHKNQLFMMD